MIETIYQPMVLKISIRIAVVLGLMVSLGAQAWADPESDRLICDIVTSPRAALGACDRLLKDRKLPVAARSRYHLRRADAHRLLRNYRRALKDYDRVLSLRPRFAAALAGRAKTYVKMGLRLKAQRDLAVLNYEQGRSILRKPLRVSSVYRRCDNSGPNISSLVNRDFLNPERRAPKNAIEKFSKAISYNPGDGLAYAYRSVAYFRLGDFSRALSDADKAVSLRPGDPAALVFRARILIRLRRYDPALRDLDRAVRLNPRVSIVYSAQGNAYNAQRRYKLAIEAYGKAIGLDQELADAYVGRAQALLSVGRPAQALPDANRAVQLHGKCVRCLNVRGSVYEALGQRRNAGADYGAVVTHYRCSLTAYASMKRLGVDPGEAVDRRDCFLPPTVAISISACTRTIRRRGPPKFGAFNAYFNRGLHYVELGRYREAVADYNSSISDWRRTFRENRKKSGRRYDDVTKKERDFLFGGTAPVLAARGEAYRGLKRYREALVDYENALIALKVRGYSLGSNTIKRRVYRGRGMIHLMRGRYDAAVRNLSRAIKISLTPINPTYARGTAYLALGQRAEAIKDFRKVLKLSPGHEQAREALKRIGEMP